MRQNEALVLDEEKIVVPLPDGSPWAVVGVVALGLLQWVCVLSNFVFFSVSPKIFSHRQFALSPFLLFLLFESLPFLYVFAALALEKHSWVVGPHSFERLSQVGRWQRRKRYSLKAWEIDDRSRQDHNSFWLVAVPAKTPRFLFWPWREPVYMAKSAVEVLEVGRELALFSGWPLEIPGRLNQLEQEELQGKL